MQNGIYSSGGEQSLLIHLELQCCNCRLVEETVGSFFQNQNATKDMFVLKNSIVLATKA